jgi:site-specific DNA-methyltransferase (adenine-specific)
MFPGYFARGHIRNHSAPGELILDPFSGRGTTLLESLLTQRNAVASDPNPVAYCITRAKSKSLQPQSVLDRITELEAEFVETPTADLEEERGFLPRFFKHAYYHTALREILFLPDTSGGIPIPLIALYQLCCWGASMEKETNLLAT